MSDGSRSSEELQTARLSLRRPTAIRAGLTRAEHLDTTGYDGLDWIFAANLLG